MFTCSQRLLKGEDCVETLWVGGGGWFFGLGDISLCSRSYERSCFPQVVVRQVRRSTCLHCFCYVMVELAGQIYSCSAICVLCISTSNLRYMKWHFINRQGISSSSCCLIKLTLFVWLGQAAFVELVICVRCAVRYRTRRVRRILHMELYLFFMSVTLLSSSVISPSGKLLESQRRLSYCMCEWYNFREIMLCTVVIFLVSWVI